MFVLFHSIRIVCISLLSTEITGNKLGINIISYSKLLMPKCHQCCGDKDR